MNHKITTLAAALVLTFVTVPAFAQHLNWNVVNAKDLPFAKSTFLYGELEVVASGPNIYYCGANWGAGAPGGSYCGIQDVDGIANKNTIFSAWDTSPTLHPQVTMKDKRTVMRPFDNEGSGMHTHLDYPWELRKVFRYTVRKVTHADGAMTDTTFWFYDDATKKWVLEAVLTQPVNGHDSVRYFGGHIGAFLENWSGREGKKPKLCFYRLWAGTSPDDLVFQRRVRGDGHWGVLNGSAYLAGGDEKELDAIIAKLPSQKDDAVRAQHKTLEAAKRTLPGATIEALKTLPKTVQ